MTSGTFGSQGVEVGTEERYRDATTPSCGILVAVLKGWCNHAAMGTPTFKALRSELDAQPHAVRVRRMVQLARQERGTPTLGALLDEMANGERIWSRLALVAARAAEDDERVQRSLTSADPRARALAWGHRLNALNGAEVVALLAGASAVDRRTIYARLRVDASARLADAVIDSVQATYGDREAASLVAGCSDEVVARMLPDLDHAIGNWPALTRRHPARVLAHLERLLDRTAPSERDRVWRLVSPAIPELAAADGDAILALIESAGPSWGAAALLGSSFGRLIRAFPDRCVAVLLRPDQRALLSRGIPRPVLRNAATLEQAQLEGLARAVRDHPVVLASLLAAIAPADRALLFEAALAGTDRTNVVWPNALLEVLPHVVRAVEVRRILGLREVVTHPPRVLELTARLPISEVRPLLEAELDRAKAEERALGWMLLVDCAGRSRDPAEVEQMLVLTHRLHNEQDPVRLAASAAIGRLPVHTFTSGGLAALESFVVAVVEARDTSNATLSPLRALMLRLLVARPLPDEASTVALRCLDRLAGPSGTIAFGDLRRLPHTADVPLVEALLPRLRIDADRDRFDLAISLAAGLGKRAWPLQPLQELLARGMRAPSDATVRRCIEFWLGDPGSRAERLGRVVAADPSTVTLSTVIAGIAMRRQDLLDLVLKSPRRMGDAVPWLRGRFHRGEVRHVPLVRQGLERWLPRQHRSYALALHQLIKDNGTRPHVAATAVRILASLPEMGTGELERYLAAPNVVVAEAALAALAWTDTPAEALPILLAHAGDDRARVAIPAAARCARHTPPEIAAANLAPLLDLTRSGVKVTARKEAVRLVADLRLRNGLETVMALAASPDVHRDIRLAVRHAVVTAYLDDQRSWNLLEVLAAGTPDEARALLLVAPSQLATHHRPRYGHIVERVASHVDLATRTAALAQLNLWRTWLPDVENFAGAAVTNLDEPAWRAAAGSLLAMLGDGFGGGLPDVVDELATTDRNTRDQIFAGRDLPARQRLQAVVALACQLPAPNRPLWSATVNAAASRLTGDHDGWAIELILAAHGASDLARSITVIDRRVADRPIAAAAAATAIEHTLHREPDAWAAAELLGPATDLARSASTTSWMLALALVEAAGTRTGWAAPWSSLLRTLRRVSDGDLAAAALAISTRPE